MKLHFGRAIAAAVIGSMAVWTAGCNGKQKPAPSGDAKPAATAPVVNPRHAEPGRAYDPNRGFSIAPPAQFVSKGAGTGPFMTFLGPKDWGYAATLTVTDMDDDGTPIERIGEALKNDLRQTQKNYTVVQEGLATIDGRKAYTITARFTQAAYNLESVQYYVRGNNRKAYILTFTAHARSFSSRKQAFEAAALSAATD